MPALWSNDMEDTTITRGATPLPHAQPHFQEAWPSEAVISHAGGSQRGSPSAGDDWRLYSNLSFFFFWLNVETDNRAHYYVAPDDRFADGREKYWKLLHI